MAGRDDSRGAGAAVVTGARATAVSPAGVLKQMRTFFAQKKLERPVFIYDVPDYDAINERLGLPGPVPATVAIDCSGAIVARHAGRGTRTDLLR